MLVPIRINIPVEGKGLWFSFVNLSRYLDAARLLASLLPGQSVEPQMFVNGLFQVFGGAMADDGTVVDLVNEKVTMWREDGFRIRGFRYWPTEKAEVYITSMAEER